MAGDCPVAEAMAEVEFQDGGNYYLDSPELMAQVASTIHKIGDAAPALRAYFDAKQSTQAPE